MSATTQMNQLILKIEKDFSAELQILSEMKIFPGAELAIIRKEKKAIQDSNLAGAAEDGNTSDGAGNNNADESTLDPLLEVELNLAERKLNIIRARRIDEQDAIKLQQKKMAKAKQLEEVQARDPANFRNPKRF